MMQNKYGYRFYGKLILWNLFLVLLVPKLNAQNSSRLKTQIDSMNQMIKKQSPCITSTCLEVYLSKAKLFHAKHKWDSAEDVTKKMILLTDIALGKEYNKSLLKIKSYAYEELGMINYDKASYKKAYLFFNKSFSIREKCGDQKGIVEGLNELMFLSIRLGQDSIITQIIKKVFKLRTEIEDSFLMAINWQTIGTYYSNNKRNIDSALLAYKKANALFRITESKNYLAKSLRDLSSVYGEIGDVETALNNLFEALAMEETLNNTYGIIKTKIVLSNMYLLERQTKKAKEFLLSALNLLRNGDYKDLEGNILFQLAVCSERLNQLEEAMKYALAALTLVKKHELGKGQLAVTYGQIGVIYEKQGNLSKAIEFAKLGLELKQSNNIGIIGSYGNIASLYIKMGDYSLAEKYAKKSFDLSKKLGFKQKLQSSSMLLHHVYKSSKEYKKALQYYEVYVRIKDSLNSREAEKTLIEKEAEFKISLKEKENKLSKKRIMLLERDKQIKNYSLLGLVLILILGISGFVNYYQKKRNKELETNRQIIVNLKEIEKLKLSLQKETSKNSLETINNNLNDFLDIPLSEREVEVLTELSKGLSNKLISEKLFVSVNTIKTHIKNIYIKLDVNNRAQAIRKVQNLKKQSI